MPKQATVTLGGRDYTITEKPFGLQTLWCERLDNSRVMLLLKSLDGFVNDIRAMADSVPEGGNLSDIDMGKAIELLRVLPSTAEAMLHSTRDMNELIFEYEPKLKTDRKWLEKNAYQDEMTAAFMEVLKLVFPIMGVWAMVSGSLGRQTPGNSVSANGALNGLPVSGPKKKALPT